MATFPRDDTPDLYARQTLKQTTANHAGGTRSPDLLPWGTEPDPDPAALATPASMQQDPGAGLVPGMRNVIYTRVRNPATRDIPGRLFLGAAPPAYLCWPDTLTPVPSTSGKAGIDVKVPAGEVGVAREGFVYAPGSSGDCLAAWVTTLAHPVTPPVLDDVNALLAFLRATPSWVQRSTAFGLENDQYVFLAPYDQRRVAAAMVFELAWSNCPVDWKLALLPRSGGTDVSIDTFQTGMTDGSRLIQRNLPAGFATTLALSIDAGGTAPAADTCIEVRVSMLVDGAPAAPDAPRFFQLGGHRWCSQPGTL